jgi:hypothetical protein
MDELSSLNRVLHFANILAHRPRPVVDGLLAMTVKAAINGQCQH